MKAEILPDRDCSIMRPYAFPMTSTILYWHAKNRRKPGIAFPSVKEWNQSGYAIIVNRVSEFMNIFGASVSSELSASLPIRCSLEAQSKRSMPSKAIGVIEAGRDGVRSAPPKPDSA